MALYRMVRYDSEWYGEWHELVWLWHCMTWYGVVMAWCGIVWCGMVWYGVVLYHSVWYDQPIIVWYGEVRFCMA